MVQEQYLPEGALSEQWRQVRDKALGTQWSGGKRWRGAFCFATRRTISWWSLANSRG